MAYWMAELANRSEGTRTQYRQHMDRFLAWAEMDANALITMKKDADAAAEDPRDARIVEVKVKAYLRHLEERGLSAATQQLAYSVINSFFKENCHPLAFTAKDRPEGDSTGSRIPEKSEVRAMLNAARSQTLRALILFLKDSGLRVSDAVRLRWDDATNYGNGFLGWQIVTKKRGVKGTPFVGPEATEALTQLPRKGARVFPMKAKTGSNALRDIIQRARLKGLSGHGLRKYFNTELEGARVPEEYRYQFMGKKSGPYDEKRSRVLFEEYRRAYGHLKVFGVDEGLSRRLGEVEADNERLKREIRDMRDARRESDDIMNQLFEDPKFLAALKERVKELKI